VLDNSLHEPDENSFMCLNKCVGGCGVHMCTVGLV
jgi:hypothetical protein